MGISKGIPLALPLELQPPNGRSSANSAAEQVTSLNPLPYPATSIPGASFVYYLLKCSPRFRSLQQIYKVIVRDGKSSKYFCSFRNISTHPRTATDSSIANSHLRARAAHQGGTSPSPYSSATKFNVLTPTTRPATPSSPTSAPTTTAPPRNGTRQSSCVYPPHTVPRSPFPPFIASFPFRSFMLRHCQPKTQLRELYYNRPLK